MKNMNAMLLIDGYKLSHREQYPQGTKLVYSNFTPRGDKLFTSPLKDGKMITFGSQSFIKTFLVDLFNDNFFNRDQDEVVNEFQKEVETYLGVAYNVDHIRALHKLGYLPVEVKTLDEGSVVPMKVPVLTIKNTKEEFFWIVNYLETLLSEELWKPATAATTAFHYRKMMEQFAEKTCDDKLHIPFQCHDFAARGLSGAWDAASTGMGHLTSFMGTDSVNAIPQVRYAYGDEGFIAGSIPATEHSVACANIALEVMRQKTEGEFEFESSRRGEDRDDMRRGKAERAFLKRLLTEVYPSGLFSYVADTYDFWRLLTEIAPSLKEEIMARDGKVVFRPDSGNPVDIICGLVVATLDEFANSEVRNVGAVVLPNGEYVTPESIYGLLGDSSTTEQILKLTGKEFSLFLSPNEVKGSIAVLFEQFGGTVNSKGYKVLDPHVGLIYGDSITLTRAKEILERLEQKGFSSSNVVFGVGSFTYQYATRDTFAHAMKATYIEVEGVDEGIDLFKDPKTGDGGKKSAKGLLRVDEVDGELVLSDSQTWEQEAGGKLITRFKDGKMYNETSLLEIRGRINSHLA